MVKCNQCGYEWEPKVKGRDPVVCTRCKRYDWQEPNKKEPERAERADDAKKD